MIKKYKNHIINKLIYNATYKLIVAGWQSGYAAACKAVHSGSIPDSASRQLYSIKKYSHYGKGEYLN